MRILENLEPQNVFYYFEEICKIPHGSGNTRQISDYLKAFADEHGLYCRHCHFPESPNHGHSEIDARDEVSVHDIHMNIGSSRLVNGANLLSQSAGIGSQH